jgi:putative membrane protein
MLVIGIVYHLQFMYGLREQRKAMTGVGLVHSDSHFAASFTLTTALLLLLLGATAIVSMVFHIGPFG